MSESFEGEALHLVLHADLLLMHVCSVLLRIYLFFPFNGGENGIFILCTFGTFMLTIMQQLFFEYGECFILLECNSTMSFIEGRMKSCQL